MTEEKPAIELSWPEIAASIFASKGIKTGLWRLAVKIRFAGIHMQFAEKENDMATAVNLPTSIAAIEAIALIPSKSPGPMIFDAADPWIPEAKFQAKPVANAKPKAAKAIKPRNQMSKTPPIVPKANTKPTNRVKKARMGV